ncbi:hypothetical protein CAK95_17565 [Pseudorhodoplanes sinuspersici]|uniref:Uncharacterized protein n=2 Tax=Pseudorhodoplanes sinuspersici TaxID=1235591 RepID=A0A1W6ZTF4_9HYPH|nr:hypothetical protein CAK95_17565 [Pseudorhodoplanes sinuspersici]
MFRIGMLAAVCAGLLGCAGVEKAINDRAKEIIDSQKIPDASLAPEQVARLEKLSDDSQVVWVKAGTQADGKVFVCYVTKTPQINIWGKRLRDLIYVHAGVFERGDTFKELSTVLLRDSGLIECHARGIEPPVRKVLRDRFDFSTN